MKELDDYVLADAKLAAAKIALAKALGLKSGDFRDFQDSRHQFWCLEHERWSVLANFAPDAATLLEGMRLSRTPRALGEARKYPLGFTSARLAQDIHVADDRMHSDKSILRVGELVGLMFDYDEIRTLTIVRADREVQIP